MDTKNFKHAVVENFLFEFEIKILNLQLLYFICNIKKYIICNI